MEALRSVLVSGAADPLVEAFDTPASGRLLLAVDQLEELFTICRSAGERSAFVDTVARAAADPEGGQSSWSPCAPTSRTTRVVPKLAQLLGANHALVGPMQPSELRRSVELPAGRVGLRVEPRTD